MSTIPWVRGLRTSNEEKKWKTLLINILLNDEHKIINGENTKKTEIGLNIEHSRYWYIGSFHNSFGHALMIWFLKTPFDCEENHSSCGGVCPSDTGGIWHGHNEQTKNSDHNEKIAFFNGINLQLMNYMDEFKSMLNKEGIDSYVSPSNDRNSKWEGRLVISKVSSHIIMEEIYLSSMDKQALISEVRDLDDLKQSEKDTVIQRIIELYVEVPFATTAIPMVSQKLKEKLNNVA